MILTGGGCVVRLVVTDPFAGRLPIEGADGLVEAVDPGPMTLVIAKRGSTPKVAGLAFPEPGTVKSSGNKRLVWMGPGQALLCGVPAPAAKSLVCVDHSDAWAIARISGIRSVTILARLVPVDLRVERLPVGATARTLVGHMTGSVSRVAENMLEVMVMRSMAGTLVQDLVRAMRTSER